MKFTSANINNYIKKKESTYKIFDINYNEKEKKIINKIDVQFNGTFSFYGKFNKDKLIEDNRYFKGNILEFLKIFCNINDDNIIKLKKIIYKIIETVVNGYNKKYIWFEIRTSLPNKNFKIPRWHFDGYKNQSKFVTVLKGPGTLIIKDTDIKSRNNYFDIQKKLWNEISEEEIKKKTTDELLRINDNHRKILANKLKPDIDQPNNNQGLIFLTDIGNNNKIVGIHSEPDVNDKRVFISIMCGTKNFIMNLHK